MMAKQMQVKGNDAVLIAASVLFLLIVGESVYCLHWAPSGWKEVYDVVVKGTLVPLFTTVVTVKIAYTFGAFLLNKFTDK